MYKLKEYLPERAFRAHDTGRGQNVADIKSLQTSISVADMSLKHTMTDAPGTRQIPKKM